MDLMSWIYWPRATVYYLEAYVLFEDFLSEKIQPLTMLFLICILNNGVGEITPLLQLLNEGKPRK